jgi:hypothetical protein
VPPPETAVPGIPWVEKDERSCRLVELLFQVGQQCVSVLWNLILPVIIGRLQTRVERQNVNRGAPEVSNEWLWQKPKMQSSVAWPTEVGRRDRFRPASKRPTRCPRESGHGRQSVPGCTITRCSKLATTACPPRSNGRKCRFFPQASARDCRSGDTLLSAMAEITLPSTSTVTRTGIPCIPRSADSRCGRLTRIRGGSPIDQRKFI